nr:hypothetical protein [Duganella sp. HH101]
MATPMSAGAATASVTPAALIWASSSTTCSGRAARCSPCSASAAAGAEAEAGAGAGAAARLGSSIHAPAAVR